MVIQSSNTNFAAARSYKQKSASYTTYAAKNTKAQGSNRTESLTEQLESIRKIRQQTLDYLLSLLFKDKSRTQVNDYNTTNYFSYHEDETMSFQGNGTVLTADGREIIFNIELTMSRSFTMEYSQLVDVEQPVLCDPLVINLDQNCTEVSNQKFLFDLDTDGVEDSISFLGKGSGFLVLDKNKDGVINDGSELFGTKSGNGFADLAVYDKNHNGWIDEADEIFDALKIWMKSEDGTNRLISLKEAGVGALYLGSCDTQFSLTNEYNYTNAMIRKTGMFLYENGMAGTMHQLDLAT